jgi:hypothetical protein
MRLWVMAALAACGAASAGYLDDLDDATPAAAALIYSKAADWIRASAIIKDRAGFFIFQQREFPRKKDMSQDDMIRCIDGLAAKAEPTRAVEAMINECGGSH